MNRVLSAVHSDGNCWIERSQSERLSFHISNNYDMADRGLAAVNDDACSTLERLYDDPDEQIEALLANRPPDEVIRAEHEVFRAMANEDRLRILEVLRSGESCGCELMVALDAPQSTVSTHLRNLRDAGLVNTRKKGRWTYYRIADSAVIDLLDLAQAISDG